MNVTAEEALARENSQRITQAGGSIMNLEVLTAVTDCVDVAVQRYGGKFNAIIKYETTGQDVRRSLVDLGNRILDRLQEFLNPEILVVPRQRLETLPTDHGGAFGKKAVEASLACITACARFMRRADAERDFNYVQIIPCALLKHDNHAFLFTRKDTDIKYRLYGKATIWQGCHVSRKDSGSLEKLLEEAILERVSRSLFLSHVFPIEPLGYCWDKEDEISSRHFGAVYGIQIDNRSTIIDLKKKEFRRRRGHGLTGEFLDWRQLAQDDVQGMLESWSRAIVWALGKKE